MKEKLKEIFTENWILQNMTKVITFLLVCLWIFFTWQQFLIFFNWYFDWDLILDLNILSFTQVLSFSWLTMVFWYWYKKYERDKEIEIIDKYWKKFNEINSELGLLKKDFKENKDKIKRKYNDLFNLYYEEYYLRCKGFISEELWREWEGWIEIEIHDFIDFSIYKLYSFEDNDIFISYIYWEHLRHYSKDNISYKGETFIDFIDKKLEKIKQDYYEEIENKNLEYDDDTYTKMKKLQNWLETIIETNKKWREKLNP